MKKRQNNFARASALQITLSAALISISAVFLAAASFKAAPAASELSAAIAPDLEDDNDLAIAGPVSGPTLSAVDASTFDYTGSLNTARRSHTATLLPNGQVLVAGGYNNINGAAIASAELYDPASGNWTATGSLNTARQSHTATLLPNGKVLVAAGGANNNSGSPTLISAELYDPASGSWTVTSSLNTARSLHTATLLPNGKVLVAGGGSNSVYVASAELYDPASGSWTATGSLNTAYFLHTATLLPTGKVLVAGVAAPLPNLGVTGAELYDPANGSWTATGSLNTARYAHKATLLPNGKVLVAGGVGFGLGYLTSAELYDPASGSWTATGSLNTARNSHTATLLPNGQVLVAGGYNNINGAAIASAELYDPASGSWTATGSLNTARQSHTATLLPNGQVLVAAGGENYSGALISAELYSTTGPELCVVCHRRAFTVSLPCDGLEYQRHLDHGDTFGPCPLEENSPAAEDSNSWEYEETAK